MICASKSDGQFGCWSDQIGDNRNELYLQDTDVKAISFRVDKQTNIIIVYKLYNDLSLENNMDQSSENE